MNKEISDKRFKCIFKKQKQAFGGDSKNIEKLYINRYGYEKLKK